MNESSRKTSVKIKAEDGKVDEIVSTPGHKYYLPDNAVNRRPDEILEHASYEGLGVKWVSACDLRKGDRVLLADADALTGKSKYGIVIGVKTEDCEPWTTYNFEVEDAHTYYVGENGVLVHNMDCHARELARISKEGKELDCEVIADRMETYLKSKDVTNYRRVNFQTRRVGAFETRAGVTVSQNGYHVGIEYGGLVYDNMVAGVTPSAWMSNFAVPAHLMPVKVYFGERIWDMNLLFGG